MNPVASIQIALLRHQIARLESRLKIRDAEIAELDRQNRLFSAERLRRTQPDAAEIAEILAAVGTIIRNRQPQEPTR